MKTIQSCRARRGVRPSTKSTRVRRQGHSWRAAAVAATLGCAAIAAHADSVGDYIKFEAGIGLGIAKDMGNGTWVQAGLPDNRERLTFPAIEAGFTGTLWKRENWDVRYHISYVYLGEQSASVDGVPDDQYNTQTHAVTMPAGERLSPFNGHGHIQGVPLSLDVGYTYRGWRLGAEAGAWIYWQTWHESLYDLAGNWDNLSHKTIAQLGYVVGASVERGPISVSYRYYSVSQKWNPDPGLVTGTHVVMLKYRY